MSGLSQELQALLQTVEGSDDEVEAKARASFGKLYCGGRFRGEVPMYQGGKVIFFEDRFDHAFFTSPDRARRAYSKAKLARDRIERMAWIGAMIRGAIPGVECWEVVPHQGRQHPRDRALVLWQPGYVVWLWPTNAEGVFKFSSAYPIPAAEIARSIRGGRKSWKVEEEGAP